jgi:CheY-specific phosphatase CheX
MLAVVSVAVCEMNVEYINPFIESVSNYFKSKLGAEASRGDLGVSKGEVNVREFAAFIGYSGSVQGIVAIFIPVKTALGIASFMEKKDVKVVDDSVNEHLKVVIKAIAADAKDHFPAGGDIKMSSSAVLRGSEFAEKYKGGTWLEMAFDSSIGDFKLRVALAAG